MQLPSPAAFQLSPFKWRPLLRPACSVAVLPLVCTAFRRLLSGPSACLWPDVTFEADIAQVKPWICA
jgi:hypothetical protein